MSPIEPRTPHQKKLVRAAAWLPADLDLLFIERPADALTFLASVAESRSLVGSTKAYPLLHPLLFRLVDRPKLDPSPLFPLLRALCAFPGYDPGGTRQFEWVRLQALRLLARHGDPLARAVIDRFVERFPERPDRTYAVSLVEVLAEAATALGARELEPALRALLDTMLLEYSPKKRAAELAGAEEQLRKLSLARGERKRERVSMRSTKATSKEAASKSAASKNAASRETTPSPEPKAASKSVEGKKAGPKNAEPKAVARSAAPRNAGSKPASKRGGPKAPRNAGSKLASKRVPRRMDAPQ